VRVRSWLALIAGSALLYVSLWIVIPGPTYSLFVLSVGAREISIWLLMAAVIVAALAVTVRLKADAAYRDRLTRRIATLTLSLAALAGALSALPLVWAPAVARRFDAAMRTALGDDFLRGVPAEIRGRMRSRPLVIADLLRGVDAGDSRVTDGILFGAPDGIPLTLSVYRPVASGGPWPAVVQIYGGGVAGGRARRQRSLRAVPRLARLCRVRH